MLCQNSGKLKKLINLNCKVNYCEFKSGGAELLVDGKKKNQIQLPKDQKCNQISKAILIYLN